MLSRSTVVKVGLLAGLFLLASCAPPHTPQRVHRQFLPLAYAPPPSKLGISGGNCAMLRAIGASWFYAWGPDVDTSCDAGVPMIWGPPRYDGKIPDITSNSPWIAGPNECDLVGQCNTSPEDLAPYLRAIYEKYPHHLHLSPVPSNEHPEHLQQTRDAYYRLYGEYPPWSALAMHCYGSALECIDLAKRYEQWGQEWGISEGWLTEFTYNPTFGGRDWRIHLDMLVSYIESSSFWTRYSPFVSHIPCERDDPYWNCEAAGDPSLFDKHGNLTEVGMEYANR